MLVGSSNPLKEISAPLKPPPAMCSSKPPESTGIKGYIGGTLRQSIDSRVKDGGFQGEIFTGVEYAKYQNGDPKYDNNGTSKIKGKRFMEKGVIAALKTLTKLLKK